MPKPEIDALLFTLDHAWDRKSWHGPNLRGSLRGLTLDELAFRPAPSRHDIWELAVHAAYWKYAVLRILTGAPRGSFPLEGSNWFPRPEGGKATASAWRADLALLARVHADLRAAVAGLSPRRLHEVPAGTKFTRLALVAGAAAHDLYHAGQIQLLKRLFRENRG